MSNNQVLVTIAIPTYNRFPLLKKALGSALAQTYPNIEIVVLDNASTDGTHEYLAQQAELHKNIKIIRNKENIGAAKNHHQILQYVSGQYLNVLSDDDILSNDFIKVAINYLETHSEVAWWHAGVQCIDSNGEFMSEIYAFPQGYFEKEKFLNCWFSKKYTILISAITFRVSILKQLGGLTESLFPDFSVLLRMANASSVYFDHQILFYYRMHPNNASFLPENFLALYDSMSKELNILFEKEVITKSSLTSELLCYLFSFLRKVKFLVWLKIYLRLFMSNPWGTFRYTLINMPRMLFVLLFGRGIFYKFMRRIFTK
jgi:GT2 family glycosyltransferase